MVLNYNQINQVVAAPKVQTVAAAPNQAAV